MDDILHPMPPHALLTFSPLMELFVFSKHFYKLIKSCNYHFRWFPTILTPSAFSQGPRCRTDGSNDWVWLRLLPGKCLHLHWVSVYLLMKIFATITFMTTFNIIPSKLFAFLSLCYSECGKCPFGAVSEEAVISGKACICLIWTSREPLLQQWIIWRAFTLDS